MLKMDKLSDVDFLKYDVTNVGYFLREGGRAAVIGVGGGRDMQSALLLGMEHVIGVERIEEATSEDVAEGSEEVTEATEANSEQSEE